MDEILIGKVVTAVGIKGEVKVYNYSDADRFTTLKKCILKKKNDIKEVTVKKARNAGNTAVVLFSGIEDRNAAELLVNYEIYITEEELRELPGNTYYIRDLIGCCIIDDETEAEIGIVKDVDQTSAQDNYEVEISDGRIVLIPAVKEFIKKVDIADKTIRVKLIPGFIDDAVEA